MRLGVVFACLYILGIAVLVAKVTAELTLDRYLGTSHDS